MKTKVLIFLFIIAAVFCAAIFLLLQYNNPVTYTADPLIASEQKKSAETATTTPQTKQIIYTDGGFNPAVTRIKPGDSVTFKNQSNAPMSLVSDGADSVVIPKGKDFKTTMTEIGTLSFSALENPKVIGIIIVQ